MKSQILSSAQHPSFSSNHLLQPVKTCPKLSVKVQNECGDVVLYVLKVNNKNTTFDVCQLEAS